MKSEGQVRVLYLLVVSAIVLTVGFSALFVRQELERRRAGIEFLAFRVMTAVLDDCASGGSFGPSRWPELLGFALYDETGAPLLRTGTAPESLDRPEGISFPGVSNLSGSTITLLRRTDGRGGPGGMRAPRRGMMPMMRNRMAMPGHMDGISPGQGAERLSPPEIPRPIGAFAFIALDVSAQVRQGRIVLLGVALFLATFFAIVFLLVTYSRRLVAYGERERETAHLVQLGEAARTLAHEIKNPLGVIQVQCATLRRTVGEDRVRNVSVIEEETSRLALLTDRLRDFLNNTAGRPEYRDAASFLDDFARRYEGLITVVPYSGVPASVYVDPARMTQVLDNLIANAREATDAVESTHASVELPELSLAVRRNTAYFSVTDRGCGIEDGQRDRLFKPFFTTKVQGSGIGLALSRRFMEHAGGELSYAERPGGGSTFTASLPCVRGNNHG